MNASLVAPTGPTGARSTAERLPSLTSLRWFAAVLVFGTHFAGLALAANTLTHKPTGLQRVLNDTISRGGPVGVSCFFLLSGFVLAWSARPDDTARSFLRRRFAKIYPLHLLIAALAALALSGAGQLPGPRQIVANLFLVQSWSPSQSYSLSLNPVTWSLSCEAFFYLVFPWVIGGMVRAKTSSLRLLVLLSFAVTMFLPAVVGRVFTLNYAPGKDLVPTAPYGGDFTGWFANVFPGMRLAEFLAGIAIAQLVRRGAWPRVPVGAALAVMAVGYGIDLRLGGYAQLVAGVEIPLAILVASLAGADLSGAWSPLRSRRTVWLGEVSFAFYMVHFLVVMGLGSQFKVIAAAVGLTADRNAAVPAWYDLAVGVLLLGVALLLAWGLHRGVERPMMRVLAGASSRRRAPVVRIEAVAVEGAGVGAVGVDLTVDEEGAESAAGRLTRLPVAS
jgi:peptidoglycan/LPS O-acetylase OafA/YrhL